MKTNGNRTYPHTCDRKEPQELRSRKRRNFKTPISAHYKSLHKKYLTDYWQELEECGSHCMMVSNVLGLVQHTI